ncbi:MAG: bifunctional 5-dehydro-2-deoxygluconokinase/5-dehydro-2-deoxyphosphogluconate aldolase [Alphaproteobacteria bacterium]
MSTEPRFDFVAVGRAAVDFYGEQVGGPLEDMATFAKYLGGSPANTAVGAARLGLRPAMITRVGDEHMGRFVRQTLAAEGVDVSQVRTDPERLTGLVVLGIRDRDTFPLIFYRENCADMALAEADIDATFVASAGAALLSGTHFSRANVAAASRRVMTLMRRAGGRVILDVDYRPVLWGLTGHGLGEARFVASDRVTEHLLGIVAECDVVVGTEDEIRIAGGAADPLVALRAIRARSPAIIVMKRGAAGCVIFPGDIPDAVDQGLSVPGFAVEVFNVLGAGDAFMAGFLRGFVRGEPLRRCGELANAAGSLVVARHGCAPAMPTWRELADFLARWRSVPRPRQDPVLAHLHRATTRSRDRTEVCAIAFDHRTQFEDLAHRYGRPFDDISRFKRLIADAATQATVADGAAGIICDSRYGEEVLFRLTGTGCWIARPVERPGATPLEFEDGPDPALTLRAWPTEQIAKCLVFCHPDDPSALWQVQVERLLRLGAACLATGRELLLEVIPTAARGSDRHTVPAILDRLYAGGLRPDWWKLPPPCDGAEWRAIADMIVANDPLCRGILLLGLDASEAALGRSFTAGADEAMSKGFAVGRSLFAAPAEAWFAGRIDDATARATIAENYRRLVALWRARKAA